MTDDDAPRLARDVTHAQVGFHLFALRGCIDELISIRVRSGFGELLEDEEGELMAIRQSLEFLLSDIRESRVNKSRQLRLVK